MKCNQWKQFKQQCENSCSRLTEMTNNKDIEFMDVGVVKEEDSDDEKFDIANCDFDNDHHSSDSDDKEKLTEIVTELMNPVCEIKKEFLSNELKNLNTNLKKFPKRVHNPNLILPPMKISVKKNTDLSKLDLDQVDDEFKTTTKIENSSADDPHPPPRQQLPIRSVQKRKSTKISYADDDNSENDIDSDDDTTYRKRPTIIYKCKTCRKRFTGSNLYEIHYVTAHMPNKDVSICGICGSKFGREANLELHLRRVHIPTIEEAKFHCEICNRGFVKTFHLTRHMRSHRSYTCEQCGRSFSQQTKLNVSQISN